jgi:hypothetical protein
MLTGITVVVMAAVTRIMVIVAIGTMVIAVIGAALVGTKATIATTTPITGRATSITRAMDITIRTTLRRIITLHTQQA